MVVRFSISSFLSDGEAYLGGLLDDAVPHLVGQHHVLLYQVLLDRLVRLGPNHIAHSLVKGVNLGTQEMHALGEGRVTGCLDIFKETH